MIAKMKPRSAHALFLGLALLLPACASPPSPPPSPIPPSAWIQLFDGKTLNGWTPKFTGLPLGTNYKHTFRAEGRMLRVSYDEYDSFDGKFGHLFFDMPFASYRLRLEYRFTGTQCPGAPSWAFKNSGVMLHGQPPETMRRDQDFPVSIEAQLLGGDTTGQRPTGNLCTPGTHVVMGGELVTRHCTDSSSPTFRDEQWVELELEVNGGAIIRQFINGELVLEYEQPQLDPGDPDAQLLLANRSSLALDHGSISLQAEGHPIDFRKIEVLILDQATD